MLVVSDWNRWWRLALLGTLLAWSSAGTNPAGAAIEPMLGSDLHMDPTAATVLFHLQSRAWLDLTVVLLQVAGVLSLGLLRISSTPRWADWGRRGFAAAMIGLGVAGTLCAWYGSEFALFAGATMAVLLNVAIVGPGHATACEGAAA